jgi:hypothetical protein
MATELHEAQSGPADDFRLLGSHWSGYCQQWQEEVEMLFHWANGRYDAVGKTTLLPQ